LTPLGVEPVAATSITIVAYDDAMSEYTAVVKQAGHCWIGWIQEVPGVNCQEATREELIDTLRVTLAEALVLSTREVGDALIS
jgi:predicted RNase H-like HicB family nuclease